MVRMNALKGRAPLFAKSCMITLCDTPEPLPLQPVQGTPLLTWLVCLLEDGGCRRFSLLCPEGLRERAAACFPKTDRLAFVTAADAEQLMQASRDPVLVITGAALPIGSPEFSGDVCVFSAAPGTPFPGSPLTAREGWISLRSTEDLSRVQPLCKELALRRLEKQGAVIWDRQSCWADPTVRVDAGTELLPGTILRGSTVIGRNCRLGPNTLLENCRIGDGVTVNASQCYDAEVGDGTTVGPFAYLRPGTAVGRNCRVGDFVELKNSVIGDGTKVSHLTYVGDSDVGENVNFGCGTVTVNYDRARKHRTTIGNNCFIGCNTNLVAPVTLGDGAYTAAGSTITEDVPANALAVARARQTVKEQWAKDHKRKEHK